jgi:hypothetical protein
MGCQGCGPWPSTIGWLALQIAVLSSLERDRSVRLASFPCSVWFQGLSEIRWIDCGKVCECV